MLFLQAYDAAVKDFLSRGINCIQYKDGRRVNIADYSEMALRTASKRAQMMGEGQFRQSIGNPLIIIFKHNTSCKLCMPFQGKVLIDDVYSGGTKADGDYMLLSEAMKLGLYHPRCKHGCGTFYPELEDINHYGSEEQPLNRYDNADVNAAHIDNMIQKYKRLALGSVDPDNVLLYNSRLDEWETKKQNELLKLQEENDIIEKTKKLLRIPQISASSISKKIESGEYSTELSKQLYAKHIKGTAQYEQYKKARLDKRGNPQSILTISETEAQRIITNKAGTGIVNVSRLGVPQPIECITCDSVIGQYYGNGTYHNTKKASIRYGKKSAHLIPIRGGNYD